MAKGNSLSKISCHSLDLIDLPNKDTVDNNKCKIGPLNQY